MNRRQFAFSAAATLVVPTLAYSRAPPSLIGIRRAAQQMPARFLIVMLHGYDASGGEILSQTGNLQSFAPSAAEVAPDGPVSLSYSGRSWFPIADGGRSQPTPMECLSAVDRYCDVELARLKLAPDRLILLGFSQGSIMALNVGLRRKSAPAAIIGFSGPDLGPDPLGPGKPPVLLVHGAYDNYVKPQTEQDAVARLKAEDIPVESYTLDNLGHVIDQRGIDLAGALLRRVTA
jgi:phospholipase/carboxylesterase